MILVHNSSLVYRLQIRFLSGAAADFQRTSESGSPIIDDGLW